MTEIKKTEEQQVCNECGRHCPMDALRCDRGRKAAGLSPEDTPHRHGRHSHDFHRDAKGDEGLYARFRQCGHWLYHNGRDRSSQRRILSLLSEHGGEMTQRSLTGELGVHRASVSELLGKLEKRNLIVRRQDEKDRRQALVSLTEQGLLSLQEKDASDDRPDLHTLFDVLTDEEKNTLYTILGKLIEEWTNNSGHAHHRKQ